MAPKDKAYRKDALEKRRAQRAANPKPIGAPSPYDPKFCDMLVEHMRQGMTFISFGAIVNCGGPTLCNWAERHPDFMDARIRGEALLEQYYLNMSKAAATGQLRRIKSRKVARDAEGNALRNQDGTLAYDEEFEPATPNGQVLVFLLKNILKWSDRADLTIRPGAPAGSDLDPKEKLSEIREVDKVLKELENGAIDADFVKISD